MAINKKQTSVWMKVVLITVAVVFIASFVLPAFLGWGQSNQQPATTETGATLERIAADHAPMIASNTIALENDPANFGILVNLGNTYYDWGLQIMNALGPGSGHDLPMWVSATVFYERALAVQGDDPNVRTDMAIAYFYSGNVLRAIEVIEGVYADSPDFAPAYYNGAIFYRATGRTADAVRVLERYLELEPEGPSAPAARDMLAEMAAAPAAPPAEGGSEETTTQP